MAFSHGAFPTRATPPRIFDLPPEDINWGEPEAAARDWKKMFLVGGLGVLSWVATYIGMLELIEANVGELPIVHKLVIGFSVAMLMTMIIWLLDQMFAPLPAFTKLVYVAGYIFLTAISVGFGFGFYWKVLESRGESSRSAESAVGQVQASLHAASTRLTQLQSTFEQLKQVSAEKAEQERIKGTSCPNSSPGDGPRRKLRDDDAARFSFAADFIKGRAGAVNGDIAALDTDLAKIVMDDKSIIDAKSGTRNEFLRALSRKLDLTVAGFNALRTDPQLKQLRSDLDERATKATFPDGGGKSFACPDTQLSQILRGVVRAIDQLPALEKPAIAAVEGSEATIEAFRRLGATFYGAMSFKLPPSADELRDLQKKAVQSVEAPPAAQRALMTGQAGLSSRDYVPLAIAIFVDICLLLVSMGRPMNRLTGLVPKMRAAERGPVIQILSRFNDIHRDSQVRENFELFRHVVFDYAGAYYVAVPLDAPRQMNPAQREDLRLEAQLLANLFTSFEKERIFKRVAWPDVGPPLSWLIWANIRAVRKRLSRQGSKFAQADAFRVYRFKDGAWPEIILGAVMGAAKRVEAEKRHRARMEDAHFSRSEPAFEADPPVRSSDTLRATDAEPEPGSFDWPKFDLGDRWASRSRAQTGPSALSTEPKPTVNGKANGHARRPQTNGKHTLHELQEKFGQYANSAHDELGSEDESGFGEEVFDPAITGVAPANNNTGPQARNPVDRATEPDSDGVNPAGPAIDVELRRETATFTVPLREAPLPRAVLDAIADADAQETHEVLALVSHTDAGDETRPLADGTGGEETDDTLPDVLNRSYEEIKIDEISRRFANGHRSRGH